MYCARRRKASDVLNRRRPRERRRPYIRVVADSHVARVLRYSAITQQRNNDLHRGDVRCFFIFFSPEFHPLVSATRQNGLLNDKKKERKKKKSLYDLCCCYFFWNTIGRHRCIGGKFLACARRVRDSPGARAVFEFEYFNSCQPEK